MELHLEILPPAQRKLWLLLKNIPSCFVLYGGTAIALQLGHRISVDFDFFSDSPLDKEALLREFPILTEHSLVQPEINTIDSFIDFPDGSVKIQFLAGLKDRQKRINPPLVAPDNGLKIASLKDLMATKLNTIQHRAECKDYIDIDALIQSGLALDEGLGCAAAIYGKSFDPASSLRALCSYRDGDLKELPAKIQKHLCTSARAVENIPLIHPYNDSV